MKLHRAGPQADWHSVALADRNFWQRLAARSHGYLTPANLITVLGLALVIYGGIAVYLHHFWLGLVCIVIGRLADLLDGFVAELTATKSAVGEFLDGASDKVATVVLLILFLAASIAPAWLLVVMFLPHIIIGSFSLVSWITGRRIHPSRIGKYTMAMVWVVLSGFVLLQALGLSHAPFNIILDIVALLTAAAGYYVAFRYIRGWD